MGEGKSIVERVWRSDLLDSTEHFELVELDDGYRLRGSVRIAHDDKRADINYELEVNSDRRTRNASIQIPEPDLDLDVMVDTSGTWWVNGVQRSDLDGCTDMDLGWTPATNTLPIRRIMAPIDRATTIRAAWLQWPRLVFTAASQIYTKADDSTWLYQHGEFTAGLQVDQHGVVLTYGDPPVWYSPGIGDS